MKHRITNIAKVSGYGLLAIAIVVFTVLLVTIGKGYFFDFKTRQLAGGGLILLDSKPNGASVSLNGKSLNKSTPVRLPLRDGSYDLKLTKDGFRSWQKKLIVNTSEVTAAQYPLLLPNTIATEALAPLDSPTQFKQSPDQKLLIVATGGVSPRIQLLPTGKSQLQPIYIFSPEQIATQTTVDSLVWSSDNEHILIGLKTPQQISYIVISALNPSESFELTKQFGLPLANLQFNPRNWREIYWNSPEGLRKLDLTNKTVSAVLAPAVTSFLVTEDTVLYTQTNAVGGASLLRLDRDNQSHQLFNKLPAASYQREYINFNSKQFVVIFNKTTQRVSLYPSISSADQSLQQFDLPTGDISEAPDDRYLVMRNGNNFATYDFELSRMYRFSLPVQNPGELVWLNAYHLLGNSGGSLIMFEFDGGNLETITDGLAGFAPYGSKGLDLVYSIGRSASNGSTVLHVSQIKK